MSAICTLLRVTDTTMSYTCAMLHATTVILGTATRAEALLEPICELYDEVFSAPPFLWTDEESKHHRKMLASLITEPSFGIATAETDTLVGFAYGYALPANTRWWQGFQKPLPDHLTQEWEGRTFALIDLAVREQCRRQGIGRRLVQCLLNSRAEERATLSVQPSAADAQAFYDHLGWHKVGRKEMPPGAVSPLFDVYVRALDTNP